MYLQNNTYLQGNKYQIVRHISSGGFGNTYEGIHVLLDKRVAIKEFFVKDFCNRDEKTAQVTTGITSKTALVEKLRKKFIDEAYLGLLGAIFGIFINLILIHQRKILSWKLQTIVMQKPVQYIIKHCFVLIKLMIIRKKHLKYCKC